MKKLIFLLLLTSCTTFKPNCNISYKASLKGSNTQSICINNAIVPITYIITGATGASVTGLPTGVTGTYKTDTLLIQGTPTLAGTFNYTVTTIGQCTPVSATGVITVSPQPTIILAQ